MSWGAARSAICIIAWVAIPCLAMQGCASVEQQAAGDDAGPILSGDQGGGVPQLPLFQPASVTSEDMMPQKRPPQKQVRRAKPKPATEIARLPDPAAGDPPAADPASVEEAAVPVAPPVAEPVAPKLVGLNEQELVAALGAPTERQELMPGKLWRYELPGCTVSVSLYPEVQTMIFRSLSYEVTSNDDTPDGVRACLSRRQSLVSK